MSAVEALSRLKFSENSAVELFDRFAKRAEAVNPAFNADASIDLQMGQHQARFTDHKIAKGEQDLLEVTC